MMLYIIVEQYPYSDSHELIKAYRTKAAADRALAKLSKGYSKARWAENRSPYHIETCPISPIRSNK